MNRLLEKLTLDSDLARGLRGASAFTAALLICFHLREPLAAQFVATTALNVSLVQLRGAYHLRSAILAGMIAVLTASAFLGSLVAGNLIAAVISIGGLALLSGQWRQLSSDYGPPLGVGSALLFLLAIEGAAHGGTPVQIAMWTAIGGAGAAVIHLGLWLFRPQHPLRHAVAEAWLAAADLFDALRPPRDDKSPATLIAERHRTFREMLDRTAASLTAARSRSNAPFVSHLEVMLHEAAHFTMQVLAFRTASAPLLREPDSLRYAPALDSLMAELASMARSVATALVLHREENLAVAGSRLHTCERLLEVLTQQLAEPGADPATAEEAKRLLHAMRSEMQAIRKVLEETIDQQVSSGAQVSTPPEITSHSEIPVNSGTRSPALVMDPVLLRYSLRMAAISMLGMAIYLWFAIPRGNWIALAMIVVLQPNYGSTRQRAVQRVGGTLAGALLGSAFLLSPMPVWLLEGLACAMAFGFAYFLRSRYGTSIFFVTLMLVLITELHMPVHLDFTIFRLLSNSIGAGAALVAALYFWPSWEGEKLPTLLSRAIQANGGYFATVIEHLRTGDPFSKSVVRAKQHAERAGHIAAASLQRMLSEPASKQRDATRAAALVTCNQRLTGMISLLATRVGENGESLSPANARVAVAIQSTLEKMAEGISSEGPEFEGEEPGGLGICAERDSPISWPLEKVSTEVRAMLLAIRSNGPQPPRGDLSQ